MLPGREAPGFSLVPPHAHAAAEGAAQLEGRVPVQTQLHAEPGKDGLRSCVPLIEK